jgi:plasmid maintenance system antidote protein VapI
MTAQAYHICDMTANEFAAWLAAMKITGAEAARLLHVTPNTVTRYRREGAPRAIGLACAALFHRLEEWK